MNKKTIMPFEQALLDATLEEFADIPDDEEEIAVTFSPSFVAKSKKLIRHTQQRIWPYVNTTMKRIVWIAIIAALLAQTVMAIPAVREAVIRFFLHDEGTHFEFTFDPEQAATAPDSIETVYLPTYIPDGFQEETRAMALDVVSVIWYNPDTGSYMDYEQFAMPEDPEASDWYGLNSEGVTRETLHLNGYEVIKIYDDEYATFAWTDNEYFYNLSFYAPYSFEVMQQVFYSIQVDETVVIDD